MRDVCYGYLVLNVQTAFSQFFFGYMMYVILVFQIGKACGEKWKTMSFEV